jgi:hypothetical protein
MVIWVTGFGCDTVSLLLFVPSDIFRCWLPFVRTCVRETLRNNLANHLRFILVGRLGGWTVGLAWLEALCFNGAFKVLYDIAAGFQVSGIASSWVLPFSAFSLLFRHIRNIPEFGCFIE